MHTHAVPVRTLSFMANFITGTNLPPAFQWKAIPPCTALPRRALHANAVRRYTLPLEADLTEIRALLFPPAVIRIAPSVGAYGSRPTLHVHARIPLAYPVDTHLSVTEATHFRAVGGIAETTRAAFSRRTLDTDAASLGALVFHANFPVARALLGLAVDGIALPGSASLSGWTIDVDTTRLLALLVDADLSLPGTVPPCAIPWVAVSPGTGTDFIADDIEAGYLNALVVEANKPLRAVVKRAVGRHARTSDQHAVGTFLLCFP